tara:strand:- start:4393 stop:5979 length:1587 start_codon:yes stop_codon:yes gene_type:complete
MAKIISYDKELFDKLCAGVGKLASAVSVTLGPRGRNVILQKRKGEPIITKDGVTVAEFFHESDPVENAGSLIVKQASRKTNTVAGDGTTTATVLANALLQSGRAYIEDYPPVELKKGIEKCLAEILTQIDRRAIPITSLEQINHIATISANNDKVIGDLISTATDQVGKDGSLTIKEGRSLETSLEIVEGLRIDGGYISQEFVNDERKNLVKFEEPFVLVANKKLDNLNELMPILEQVARDGRPLVIFAENIEGKLLAALIMNSIKGSLKIAAVKIPHYGQERKDILEDVSLISGANFFTPDGDYGLTKATLSDLGTVKNIEIGKNRTLMVDGQGDYEAIDTKIERLRAEMAQTEDERALLRLQERITRLASSVGVIYVGAATEVEMVEKKHRIEDALEAVKAAQDEGVVPGGGVTLARISYDLNEETYIGLSSDAEKNGFKLLKEVIRVPMRRILENAGINHQDVFNTLYVEHIKDDNIGFNVLTEEFVDMIENGVIDPAKVTKNALINAVSAAGSLLTTNCAIIEK